MFDDEYEPTPWLFDWTITYGGNFPKVELTPRSGITWSDGEPFTATDISFSYQYLSEYQTLLYGGIDPQLILEVSESDESVVLNLSSSVGSWLETGLRTTMLPAHVWDGNERPRSETIQAPVGTGAYTVEEFSPGSEILLTRRSNREFGDWSPQTPVQQIRFVEQSMTPDTVVESLSNRSVHATAHGGLNWETAPPNNEAISSSSVPSGTVGQLLFNLDRTPFDDRLLRECLIRTFDARTYLAELGPDSTRGQLAVPEDFSPYRSNELTPDDDTRYRAYTHEVDDVVNKARSVLKTPHPDYNYSFRAPLSTSIDSRYDHMLHVDDQPFHIAHKTATSSQAGALKIVLPQEDVTPVTESMFNDWVSLLIEIGIPTELQIIPYSDVIRRVFQERDFDIANVRFTHDSELSSFATIYSTIDTGSSMSLNAMGYNNANAELREALGTRDRVARQQNIEDALLQIYEDIPVYPYHHEQRFNVTSTQFENWTATRQGVTTHKNWVGVTPNPNAQVTTETATPNEESQTTTEPPTATQTETTEVADTGGSSLSFELPNGTGRLGAVGAAVVTAAAAGGWYFSRRGDDEMSQFEEPESSYSPRSNRGDSTDGTASNTESTATEDVPAETDDEEATADQTDGSNDTESEPAATDTTGDADGADESEGDDTTESATNVGSATGAMLFSNISELTDRSYRTTRGYLEEYSCAPTADTTRTLRLFTTTEDADESHTEQLNGAIRHWRALSSHRCVPTLVTDGSEPRPWFAIQPPNGSALSELDALEPDAAVELIEGVSDAVRQAGLYNARHHALSPDAVFYDEDGEPAVIDWGLRPLLDQDVTPYTAPEQLDAGLGETGRPTDIWALGGLAYRALTGEAPFDADSDDELETAILEGETPVPSDVDQSLEAFDDTIRRALTRDLEMRYSSPHHFALDLKGAL
ncbi:ABC transporter substrate-binding protein [Haloferax gibbonsii]|uniref:ABC transporter substrate-binding protein n=1 Tax=Haloferax gibbonsii TaxID=35746 RepID=UPI0018764E9E|nr:ABC transporter substrate-binding protein [Haloferax gibbonsii]